MHDETTIIRYLKVLIIVEGVKIGILVGLGLLLYLKVASVADSVDALMEAVRPALAEEARTMLPESREGVREVGRAVRDRFLEEIDGE